MRKKISNQNIRRDKSPKVSPESAMRKREEIMGVLLIMLGIFVFIALFTYNPEETPGTIRLGFITNQMGVAGVYIAHYLIRWTIGYPILCLPFLIIAWGGNSLLGKGKAKLFKLTLLTILLAYLISLSFALHDSLTAYNNNPFFRFSGHLGGLGAQVLILAFGKFGALVFFIGVVLLVFLLSTSVSIKDLYQKLSSFILRYSVALSRVFQKSQSMFHKQPETPPFLIRRQPELVIDGMTDADTVKKPGRFEDKPNPTKPSQKSGKAALTEQLELDIDTSEEDEGLPKKVPPVEFPYVFPPLDLLQAPEGETVQITEDQLRENAHVLEESLENYGITAHVIEVHPGPVITRYELELAPGIKVSRVTSLADDLAMNLRAKRIRIVAPIPGKAAVGVEIPNPSPSMVYLREILSTQEFKAAKSPLTMGFGKTISGTPYVADLTTMPHLLIAGSTGSGKSVCLNTIITSFIYKAHPSEVQLVLIDPKRLELSTYSQLYHHHLNHVEGLKEKVATTPKGAVAVLKSVEYEMERRYEILATAGVRNIEEYNLRVKEGRVRGEDDQPPNKLYYLVLIVDELADLMITANASNEVEQPIARLTQMSRAVGIHLILATQRPSVDVITGVIKANFPARIAFQVASKVDSRTILDMNGAEKLLGRGDMLFLPPSSPEPIRLHNAYIGLNEIENIVRHVSSQAPIQKKLLPSVSEEEESERYGGSGKRERDVLFDEALQLVVRHQQGSVSLIQRRLKVGYSRAARIIDELEAAGVVGPFEGSKAREVLLRPEDLETLPMEDEGEEE
jgi:DNA segregation ATPase FtsK/SpoIIIE, S-DNA-T family